MKRLLRLMFAPLLACGLFAARGTCAGNAAKPDNLAPTTPLVLNSTAIAGCDAVVLSVRGLDFTEFGEGLEFKNILGIVYKLTGQDVKNIKADVAEKYAKMLDTDSRYYGNPLYIPRTYLYDFLAKRLPETGRKYEVISLDWNGDAGQTRKHLKDIEFWVEQAYAEAAKYNKPVHLVAHSWGTVLSHTVLRTLSEKKSPVRISKYVTMGSPLTPTPGVIDVGMKIGKQMYGIHQHVKKPANVGVWINLWAKKDIISNAIKAADANACIDDSAAPYRLALKRVINGKSTAKATDGKAGAERVRQARKDLMNLDSTVIWHGSYFAGVEVPLKSVNETYSPDLVRQYFLPLFK